MTSSQGNDDGLEAGRRRDFRGEFREMIHTDPLLVRLAEHSYPHLRLRSTFLVSVATFVLAVLTQNMMLAAVLGLLMLAGHAAVVHLLAVRDENGSRVMLSVLRGGCAVAIVVIVGTALAGSGGGAGDPGPGVAGSSTSGPVSAANAAGSAGAQGQAGAGNGAVAGGTSSGWSSSAGQSGGQQVGGQQSGQSGRP